MKQYLLPESGNFYKVNMHSHSTLSDGKQTPEELKEAYMEMGYSAIAYTEHSNLHNLSHLTDDNFVAIVSYEMDMGRKDRAPFGYYEGAPVEWNHVEQIHMNLYAKDPAQTERISVGDLRAEFSAKNINEAIRRAKEAGFLVVYNHPHWSLNNYELYSKLRGVDGIEIVNGASDRSSDLDYSPLVYDEMSREGLRMPMCVGGDDNHGTQHFGLAWTMVKADALTYGDLISAFEAGNCYASTGPEIHELTYEDGVVRVKCSEAQGIFLTTIGRRKNCVLSEHGAPPVTEAAFRIFENDCFFRITVRDFAGKHANTRVYHVADLQA